MDAALADASDTPRIAFAPNLDLFCVPSKLIRLLSILVWSLTSVPIRVLLISLFTLFTAFKTPLPLYLLLSLSLNSAASYSPVEAPDGTAALPKTPFSKKTSTSTVGFPLESSISLALIFLMFVFIN